MARLAHPPYPQQPHQPSDSDTQPYAFSPPDHPNTLPNLPSPSASTRSNNALNLSVLRRHLPTTAAIELVVPYAVVYIFSPEREGWEKCGIEGTLFVVRTYIPQEGEGYTIVVLNRRGLENFMLPLRTSEEVELTEEYVIVRDGDGEEETIYGLWIFEEDGGSMNGEVAGEIIADRARRVEQKFVKAWRNGVVDGGDGSGEQPVQDGLSQEGYMAPRGPDLMALLNGNRGQGGNVPQATNPQGLGQGQVNLLGLFKVAGQGR